MEIVPDIYNSLCKKSAAGSSRMCVNFLVHITLAAMTIRYVALEYTVYSVLCPIHTADATKLSSCVSSASAVCT